MNQQRIKMKTQKEIKKFAKLMTEFIDNEIKKSKLIHEADAPSTAVASRAKQYATALGTEPSENPGPAMSSVPSSKYAPPTIPDEYRIFTEDAGQLAVINHAMISRSIDTKYFYEDKKEGRKPQPMLIFGAPGIGKSAGVRSGALRCAEKVAKQKGMNFVNGVESLKTEYSNPESFKNNFYFIEWSKISNEDKELIMHGPAVEEEDLVHKGQKIRVNHYELRVPAKNLFIFFDVRAAGTSDQDILGIPFRVDSPVRYTFGKLEEPRIIMQRLPFLNICCNEKELHGVIMWDEINQASEQTQSALYSVILDRIIGDSKLAPGIGQFAAANGKMWGGQPIKPALASRFSTSYLWLSPEEWMVEHKNKIPPLMYDFISDSPKISFYITQEGWDKEYEPKFSRTGKSVDMSEYIKSPELGRWPNPRDLTSFAEQFQYIIQRGQSENWDQRDIIEAAVSEARERVGNVWADHFRRYAYEAFAVKWETLLNDPQETAKIFGGTDAIEPARGLLFRHFKMAFDYGKTIHNKDKYKKEASDVVKVCIYASVGSIDPISTVINRLREEKYAEKTGETPEQIDARITKIILDGIDGLEPALKSKGSMLLDLIKKSLSEFRPGAKAAPKKLETGNITLPGNQPAPSTASPAASGTETVPEKFTAFNKLFEEIATTMSKPAPVEEPKAPSDALMERQKNSMKNLAQKVNAFVSKIPVDKSPKESDREILNFINHEILADAILSKEQKQKLISVIKDAPTSINAMQVISAYTTGNIFKLV